MSTRGASASVSGQARQHLITALFGRNSSRYQERAESSSYSYHQLRKAYLERIQELHPDKHTMRNFSPTEKAEARQRFVDLKEAWNKYEAIAKTMKRVTKGDEADANFTMFGVGCSFSDNEKEKSLRCEIMDQASRGWFNAGVIPASLQQERNTDVKGFEVRLLDDDLFITTDVDAATPNDCKTPRKSLIHHMIRK